MSSAIQSILDKATQGDRLSFDEGLALISSHDLPAIGDAAHRVTHRLHPELFRTYNIDRNINYTNICTAVCDFCAFYRPPKHAEGYVLSKEELHQKIAETVELGGDQILLQGGIASSLQTGVVRGDVERDQVGLSASQHSWLLPS